MKWSLAVLMVAASILAATSPRGSEARAQRPPTDDAPAPQPPPQDKTSLWMKYKLGASQKILEGMTRGDFASIEGNANGLQVMGHLEGWDRAEMPDYKAQLHAFHHATGAIFRAAQEKNLDGVTIAYTQLTISCVQCHKIVRDKGK